MTKIHNNPFFNQPPSAHDLERWKSQAAKIFEAFSEPRTMRQVARITKIERANVCRRVDDFRKQGLIQVVKVDVDPESHFKAQYFSVNPSDWPKVAKGSQLEMFE